MSGANFILDKGFKIAAAATKYQLVKFGSADDTMTPVTAATDQAMGVLLEDCPTADVTNGRVCDVRLMGIEVPRSGRPRLVQCRPSRALLVPTKSRSASQWKAQCRGTCSMCS
jgi:hypothetical protein